MVPEDEGSINSHRGCSLLEKRTSDTRLRHTESPSTAKLGLAHRYERTLSGLLPIATDERRLRISSFLPSRSSIRLIVGKSASHQRLLRRD